MVLVAVEFRARVPSVALLLSRVTVDVLAFVGVAHLELISRPHTGAASVGWSERVAGQRTHTSLKMCVCFYLTTRNARNEYI